MTLYAVQVRLRTRRGRRAWMVLRANSACQTVPDMPAFANFPALPGGVAVVSQIHDSTPDCATATGLAYDPKSGGLWADSIEHLTAEISRAEGRRVTLRLLPGAEANR